MMFKLKITNLLPMLLFLLLASLFVVPISIGEKDSGSDGIMVGAYYYPWYWGNWEQNHKNCIDTPTLGSYDSSNSSVIVQHLNWFEQVGIDFIIFSWWGKHTVEDRNAKLVIDQITKNYTNIKFMMMVEPFGDRWEEAYNPTSGKYNFTVIYNYLFDTYTSKYTSNCFILDGKPAIGFYDDLSRNLTANGVPQDQRFSTRLIGCNSGDDWEFQVPDPSLSTQPIGRDGQINVCPRYDANGWQVDTDYTLGLYCKQWNKAISEAQKGNAKIITIISWNEFAERTQIEPNQDSTAQVSPYHLLNLTKAYIDSLGRTRNPMKSGVLAHELNVEQAQLLAANGIQWIRGDVSTNNFETNWHTIYQLSREYNFSLIGTLLPYTMNFNETFTLQDWDLAVKKAVVEFGDVVNVWEIWNEPTYAHSGSYLGYYDGSPQRYIDLMRVAYQNIKSASTGDIVLGLGGLPLYTSIEPTANNTYVMQALDWTDQIVQFGGMQYCDAISLHAYPYGPYTDNVRKNFVNSIADYRAITGKDIWITEVGQESVGNGWKSSQQEQTNFLTESYTILKEQNVEAYIWYELNDSFSNRNSTFGLFDNESQPKNALKAFSESIMDSASTPTSSIPGFSVFLALALSMAAIYSTTLLWKRAKRKTITER